MLRTIVIACAVALIGSNAAAQGRSLGVKGGVNVATQRNSGGEDEGPGLQSRIGLVAGMFATMPLFSRLELQPEALVTSKGARVDLDGITASLVADYLEIPALVRFSRRGTFNFYVAGGPALAVLLRAHARTAFAGATEDIDITEQVNRFDVGVAMGGGVEFGPIVIDGRYTLGLKDIDKDTSDAVKTTNRAVTLTVGFKF